ncbi:hypothetical protein CPB84DRAFT_1752159 [Gymnopilus junonius]|uniref:Uncharacterized protein n=1 Tax=Gymnopilus junonius TaxID=109634 RepID=A0A9P5NDL1_GYMJU|nr:hypothetical protein CPB84DRAFT_1752159 [Gymnopilus junonius]
MYFLRSVLLTAACSALAVSVSAAPTPIGADLATRDVEDAITLERRVGGGLLKAFSKMSVSSAQKGQSRRKDATERKRKANEKIEHSVSRVRAPDHLTAGLSSSERAKLHQAAHDRARAQAVTHSQKASKEERRKKWESSAGSSRKDRPSGRTRYPSPSDRHRTASSLRDANHRMQHTENIPHRHDSFSVGGHSTSGRHVRQAVGNSILYHHDPVGRGDNRNPKPFRNDAYSSSHGDHSLRGTHPISSSSHSGRPLHEYPVTSGHSGYYGSGRPGPARVITSHADGRDVFHGVVGHDPRRGGDHDDHYMAEYRPHRGSERSSDHYSNYRYGS